MYRVFRALWILFAMFASSCSAIYMVDTLRESGAGSLRAACSIPGPLTIRFSVEGTMRLTRDILCSSDKAIYAAGKRVRLTGGALRFVGVRNIYVEGLCFSDTHDDCLEIRNTQNATVNKCSLVRCGDGALDVVQGSRDVKITRNLFFQNVKTSLVGNKDSFEGDRLTRVRYEQNHFLDCSARMPRVRFAQVAVCASVFTDWKDYVLGGGADGIIRANGNFFRASDHKKIVKKFDPSIRIFAGPANILQGNAIFNDAPLGPVAAYAPCASMSEHAIIDGAGVVGDWCR